MEGEWVEGLCPCESGLQYNKCCGSIDREGPNQVASVSLANQSAVSLLPSQLQASLDSVDTCPDWFPARVNYSAQKAWLVKMSPRWYRASVFLDPSRIKGSYVVEVDLPWLESAARTSVWQQTTYIFHTAFCGSTLMAQALDAVFNCLPLREPEALGNLLVLMRTQATEHVKSEWFEYVLRLLSRRYALTQGVVVKANDYANPMMLELLKWRGDIPILFMYTPLSEFLAGCLKADNRRQWIRGRYQSIATIAPQLLNMPEALSLGDDAYAEMAAVYWSYNIALYNKAQQLSAKQLHSLDFNRMLENPIAAVMACGQMFGLQLRSDTDTGQQLDDLFGVYSKNSKFKYSPQQRNTDISKLLNAYQAECNISEKLARQLLGSAYPEKGLPGALVM